MSDSAAGARCGPDGPDAGFDPGLGYRLSPDVALRPEPFGALAYHFGTRKLSFMKAPGLVELVRGLGAYPSVTDALAGVPAGQHGAYLRALAALAASDMIVAQAGPRHAGDQRPDHVLNDRLSDLPPHRPEPP